MRRAAELRPRSIAAIVLDAGKREPAATSLRRGRVLGQGSVAEVVLGGSARGAGRMLGLGAGVALVVHLGAGVAAWTWASGPGRSARAVAAKPVMRIEHVVALAPPEPAQVVPPEPPPPAPSPPARAPRTAPPAGPPPPAAAALVVAAAPTDQAVDFTSFDIVTGKGNVYAGGVTSSTGTNTAAVHSAVVDPDGVPGPRSRSVGLPQADWSCPWPREAEALSIDEEVAVIRVVVRPDGSVASAELVSDPGHGFGPVALDCARARRFQAATDDDGQPITATSPPVRVRFTRSAG